MHELNFYWQSGQVSPSFPGWHLPSHTPLKQLRHESSVGQSISVSLLHSDPQHPSLSKLQASHTLLQEAKHTPALIQVSVVQSSPSSHSPPDSVQIGATQSPEQQIPPVQAVLSSTGVLEHIPVVVLQTSVVHLLLSLQSAFVEHPL